MVKPLCTNCGFPAEYATDTVYATTNKPVKTADLCAVCKNDTLAELECKGNYYALRYQKLAPTS